MRFSLALGLLFSVSSVISVANYFFLTQNKRGPRDEVPVRIYADYLKNIMPLIAIRKAKSKADKSSLRSFTKIERG